MRQCGEDVLHGPHDEPDKRSDAQHIPLPVREADLDGLAEIFNCRNIYPAYRRQPPI
jgi:hypothetical protein